MLVLIFKNIDTQRTSIAIKYLTLNLEGRLKYGFNNNYFAMFRALWLHQKN